MKKIQLFVVLCLGLALSLSAQSGDKGTIRGKVIDKTTGEVMMFTNVLVLESDPPIGGQTDLDGNYEIRIDPGTYSLKVTNVGYANQIIPNVVVESGKVAVADFYMEEVGFELEGVEVVTTRLERTENALLAIQAKAITVQDGISSQEMSRYGSGNAAESMKRVTGASVVDGKYIYVRGLGDRYSSAQLNGQPIPSTDPYRNSVQLDLIPANLLDNLVASKTFTPDQPGNFTGGNVNIKTKSFPERFTLSANISSSFNTQSSLKNNFLTHDGGNTDWLGFDDGGRQLPDELKDATTLELLTPTGYIRGRNDREKAERIDAASRSLNQNMTPTTGNSGLNNSVSLSFGNQYKLFNNPFGILVGANYRKSYSFYENGLNQLFELTDPDSESLNPQFQFSDTRGVENPVIGGLLNLSYKFAGSQKISFNALYNHDAEKTTRYQTGMTDILSGGVFESRSLSFKERSFASYQLSGEHALGSKGIRLEWGSSYVKTSQDEPDLRLFANTYTVQDNGDTTFILDRAEFDLPFHFFRKLSDELVSGKVDVTIPFLQSKSKFNKIKFGALYTSKDRVFDEIYFQMGNGAPNTAPYLGNPTEYFGDTNTGIVGVNPNNGRYEFGLYPLNEANTYTLNSYTGNESIYAGYAMATYEWNSLKIIGGARVEATDISVASRDTSQVQGSIDAVDVLPSINLIYKLQDKMNLRASFSQTLARPNMRELAPFSSFDGIGNTRISGNPLLERTKIQNFDLRWEWYPTPGEMYSVSTYYKDFSNPIVLAFLAKASNPEVQFQNVASAQVYGVEFEFRKNLSFLTPALKNFRLSSNLSLIRSVSDISEDEIPAIEQFNPEKGTTRALQGQSPFLLNMGLNYVNDKNGLDALLSFNIFGERIAIYNEGQNPDVYEQPLPQLDFSVKKSFSNGLAVKASAQNLLDGKFQQTMTYKDTEYILREFRRGVTFGVSISYTIK